MKVRIGFVSNSSSSMFVVAFPRKPKSAKEVQEIMFGGSPFITNPYDEGITKAEEIAKTVWEDIKPQKRLKAKTIIKRVREAVSGGAFDGRPDYEDFKITPKHITELEYDGKTIVTAKVKEQYDWERYHKASDEFAQTVVDVLLKEWEGKPIYIFNYGDNNGDYYSTLEHGEIFRNLPHKQISYH